ncbi:hypothetical protein [Bosea thiooxidans]
MNPTIRNEAEHLTALRRMRDLLEKPLGADEARELAQVNKAIKVYEESIAVMERVARKAADRGEDAVTGLTGEE